MSKLGPEEEHVSDVANNHFLDLVCARLRSARPGAGVGDDFSTRIETVRGAPFVSLWFRTRGCRHDARGGCTMCNYGASTAVSGDEMVEAVRNGLATLDPNDDMTLLLSPSGSMFDEWEVPARAREQIFRLAHEARLRTVLCETRAETLTDGLVRGFAGLFDDREAGIGIGLESANPWILKYVVNKALSLDDYRAAMALLHRHGVLSTANVLLGSPFLSEAEAIDDAVDAIQWAFTAGSDQCVLFPAHVKSHTLLHWLWQRNMYSPPSLWSLVRVLSRVGPDQASRMTISWYKDYFASNETADADKDPLFLCSPTTCPDCRDDVMALLDSYRDEGDFDVIRDLARFDCDCRRHWEGSLEYPVASRLAERVAVGYEAIGRDLLGDEWWLRHGHAVIKDVLRGASW